MSNFLTGERQVNVTRTTNPAVSSPRGRHTATNSWRRWWRRRESNPHLDLSVTDSSRRSTSVDPTIPDGSDPVDDVGTSVAVGLSASDCSNCSNWLAEVAAGLAEMQLGRLDLAISRFRRLVDRHQIVGVEKRSPPDHPPDGDEP